MRRSLTGAKFPVGFAPSRGLILDELYFDMYNDQYCVHDSSSDSTTPTLHWHSESRTESEVEAFRHRIRSHITAGQYAHMEYSSWIEYMHRYARPLVPVAATAAAAAPIRVISRATAVVRLRQQQQHQRVSSLVVKT